MHPFHLAFPVDNLKDARAFYGDLASSRKVLMGIVLPMT